MNNIARVPTKFAGAFIKQITTTITDGGRAEFGLTLISESYKILEYFERLQRYDLPTNNTMGLHIIENEFICSWCGAVNPITNKCCGQCGGSRGFILGI